MVAPGQVWKPGFLTEHLTLEVDQKVFINFNGYKKDCQLRPSLFWFISAEPR